MFKKSILLIVGLASLILGIIGIFLPLLPTTPFLILAAWCFLRSSSKMYRWLYRQPLIGEALKDWEQTGAIKRKTKVLAIFLIGTSIFFVWIKVKSLPLSVSVTVLLGFVSLFIVSRPES